MKKHLLNPNKPNIINVNIPFLGLLIMYNMKNLYPFITIEGNIGAGKTSLSQMLAHDFSAHLVLEQFDANPFIAKFYEDKSKYSLPLELTLMSERFAQLKEITKHTNTLFDELMISDYLFIKSKLYASINLKDDEWWLYQKMFDLMYAQLPEPSILLYLHVPIDKLQLQIAMRGRAYENQIENEYLQSIEDKYFELFKQLPTWKILIINAANLDFVANKSSYNSIKNILQLNWEKGIHYIDDVNEYPAVD
jgi:deoxyadenosine/deoxycytidine kinase